MMNRHSSKLRRHLPTFSPGGNKDIKGNCIQPLFFGRRDGSAHLYKLLHLDEQSELFLQDLIILSEGDKYFQEVKYLILMKEFKFVDTMHNKQMLLRELPTLYLVTTSENLSVPLRETLSWSRNKSMTNTYILRNIY